MDNDRIRDIWTRGLNGEHVSPEDLPLKHLWHLLTLQWIAIKNNWQIYELMDNIREVGGIYKCSCGIDLSSV